LSATLCLAEAWSGNLVDSKCYASEERNVNPTDTEICVDRDNSYGIRYCSARPKTKSFAIVQSDGQSFRLDAAGNAKASELVQKIGKKQFIAVTITGEMNAKAIRVSSISSANGR
jgi:hypothetical protein